MAREGLVFDEQGEHCAMFGDNLALGDTWILFDVYFTRH